MQARTKTDAINAHAPRPALATPGCLGPDQPCLTDDPLQDTSELLISITDIADASAT